MLVHAVTVISSAFDGGYLHPVAQPSLPVGGSPLTLFVPSSKVGLQLCFLVLYDTERTLTDGNGLDWTRGCLLDFEPVPECDTRVFFSFVQSGSLGNW